MKSKATAFLVAILLATFAVQAFAQAAPKAKAPAAKTAAPAATPVAATQPAAAAPKAATAPSATQDSKATEKLSEGAQSQAWWQAVLAFVIEVSKALIVPLLIVLAWVANKKWKLGLERATIEWVVSKAVGFGEQKAKVALKEGKPMDGPKILEQALKHGTDLLVTKGLVGKWGDKLADLVEAKLGEQEVAKKSAAPKPKTEA